MIKFKSDFALIVDGIRGKTNNISYDEQFAYSKSFMAKLGIKTDSAGWVDLDNKSLCKKDVLSIINQAKDSNDKLLLSSNFQLYDGDYDWYYLDPMDVELTDRIVPKTNKEIPCIRAFKYEEAMLSFLGEEQRFEFGIREDALNELINHGINICGNPWVPDIGKFDSKQYFYLQINNSVKRFAGGCFDKTNKLAKKHKNDIKNLFERHNELSSSLIDYCPDIVLLDDINIPVIIEKGELGNKDISIINDGCDRLIVSKRVRDILISNNFVLANRFSPVVTVDVFKDVLPEYKAFIKTHSRRKVSNTEDDVLVENYRCKMHDDIKNRKRPHKAISEKMAIERIKKIKLNYPENFNFKLKPHKENEIVDIALLPYYKISDGFVISDEYVFFSVDEQKIKEKELSRKGVLRNHNQLFKNCKLIGETSEGDIILLLVDKTIIQFDYLFNDEIVNKWNSIQEFFYFTL